MSKPKNVDNVDTKTLGTKMTDPRQAWTGTHKEDVKKESSIRFSEITPNIPVDDNMVIAEDERGLYVTAKNHIGDGLLDGFRMYRRKEYSVVQDGDNYSVTNKLTGKSVTI